MYHADPTPEELTRCTINRVMASYSPAIRWSIMMINEHETLRHHVGIKGLNTSSTSSSHTSFMSLLTTAPFVFPIWGSGVKCPSGLVIWTQKRFKCNMSCILFGQLLEMIYDRIDALCWLSKTSPVYAYVSIWYISSDFLVILILDVFEQVYNTRNVTT